MSARAVCIEIGGGSVQTVVFDNGTPRFVDGPYEAPGAPLLIAVPGLIEGSRVVAASNLGWLNADPVEKLGLQGPLHVLHNDAEAAALGEAVLRGVADLAYVGLGTGVGGAIVRDGVVVAANLFGHDGKFGDRVCPCGRTGCLETVAAGWALPEKLEPGDIARAANAISSVLRAAALPKLIVIAGGIARRYPDLVGALSDELPEHAVEASRAPVEAKSAAAWGLLRLAGLG